MPRPSKGPRLVLRPARPEKRQSAGWVIRDGTKEISTRCGPSDVQAAEIELAKYIQSKWTPQPTTGRDGPSNPTAVLIADVLNYYAQGRAHTAPDPKAVVARLSVLLEFWGDKSVGDIRRSSCEAYVAWRVKQPIKMAKDPATARRVTDQGARRELEDLSAAIGYWNDEYPLTRRPKVVLPPKAESTRDALTRDQAARLLLASMGWRLDPRTGTWKRLQRSSALNRAHLRRFILIGLYTGTRPGVIPKLLWNESATQAWVDLEQGVIYRRGKAEKDHRTKRRPLVVIPRRLLAHMRRWHDRDMAANAQLREDYVRAGGRPEDAPMLTTVLHHGGRPLAGRVRTGFEGAIRDAGLHPDITPHWMRHTCATWLMERDVQPWEAAGYTGMSVKTLEDCYGHHRPNHQANARRAMG